MAGFTRQQMQAADQMINGSFDAVGAKPAYLSPPTSVADMYRGILPAGPAYQTGMLGRGQPAAGSPYMTAAEKAAMQRQIAASQALQQSIAAPPPVRTAQLFAPPPLPMPRPPNAPTRMDIAAMAQPAGVPQNLDELLAYTSEKAATMPDPTAGFAASATPLAAAAAAQPTIASLFAPPPRQPAGATAYAAKNAAAEAAAKAKAATATGQTGTTVYKNGVKTGNVGGGTSAQAYNAAADRSRSGPSGGNGVASGTNPWGY